MHRMSDRPFVDRKRLTNLGEATAGKLRNAARPVVTDREIVSAMSEVYDEGKVRYLRGEAPSLAAFHRTRTLLRAEKIISKDEDYPRLWRVNTVQDAPADEISCLVDPTVYISHLSAMQRLGLTNRRPTDLYLTRGDDSVWSEIKNDALANDAIIQSFGLPLYRIRHPETVRGRRLHIHTSKYFGESIAIRKSFARVSSPGQTFADMLSTPELCGGMPHVLDIFDERAAYFTNEIIDSISSSELPIVKVRAGYILDERLGIKEPRIESWVAFAQRGGSRILDPQKPFSPHYSEKWMLSLNV